jgi:hypothetical protein
MKNLNIDNDRVDYSCLVIFRMWFLYEQDLSSISLVIQARRSIDSYTLIT